MGISKRRARAGEGGWPSLRLSCFLPIPVPRKNSKSLKKSLYPIFVELGRRAWVWAAYLRGVGIIFIPDILLQTQTDADEFFTRATLIGVSN